MRTDGPMIFGSRTRLATPDHSDRVFRSGSWLALTRVAALIASVLLATGFAAGSQKPAAHEAAPQPAKANNRNRRHPNIPSLEELRSLPPDQQEKLLKENKYFQSLTPERQEHIRELLRGGESQPHPPGFFSKLRDLPPDQQEKVLENDARFQSLPPERQQQIRENLQRWNAATPAQREMLRQREEIVQSLSPEQRDQLRQIFQRWRQLPNDRQQALTQSFVKLRRLPPEQREKYLSSPEVVQQFSPEERSLLSELGNLLPKN